jgi:hypothetical protein
MNDQQIASIQEQFVSNTSDPVKMNQFHALLEKALNTESDPPTWLLAISDQLNQIKFGFQDPIVTKGMRDSA